jgi:hypothetical protein
MGSKLLLGMGLRPSPACLRRGEGAQIWLHLDTHIRAAAKRQIQEHETYAKSVHDENIRRRRRSTHSPELLPLHRPETWAFDPGFNPYLVRSRHERIAHALTARLRDRSYSPRPPAGFKVPQRSGGERTVNSFEIADEVVSNLVMRSLTRKNISRFSARAYAYRSDLGPHDAISYVASEFRREHRLFVAEYDFSKFFDTIDHEFLLDALESITSTPLERFVIKEFLQAPEPYLSAEQKVVARPARTRGIPQGTSVSLFLANLAASELDRGLERLGVGFVRYADDTLIWSTDYGRIGEAAALLHEASSKMGSDINPKKSLGIRLLTEEKNVEMRATKDVDYLGHRIGLRKVRMKPVALDRIKERVGQLIFTNLLREPMSGAQNPVRLTDIDKDYVTMIWQLRRFLYGPLSEREIRRFQMGAIPPMSFQGIMSFFPLVNDEDELQALDGWIAAQIWLAMRKRTRLLSSAGISTPTPHGLSKPELIGCISPSENTGDEVDLRIPSVKKIASVIRLAVATHGYGVVAGQAPWLYLYADD